MRESFESEQQKKDALKRLDVSISQWTAIVEEELSAPAKRDMEFLHEGELWDSSEWDSGCLLCNFYDTNGDKEDRCRECPMFERWTYGPTCFYDGSSWSRYYDNSNTSEQHASAALVLADLIRARAQLEELPIIKDRPEFMLKPMATLVKLSSGLEVEGAELIMLNFDTGPTLLKPMLAWHGYTLVLCPGASIGPRVGEKGYWTANLELKDPDAVEDSLRRNFIFGLDQLVQTAGTPIEGVEQKR